VAVEEEDAMETRRLGRIGHMSSVLLFGGAALSEVSEEDADRSIRQALDAGINHFDTAAGYGDSELHLGRWMPQIRDRIFLATKTGDRAAADAYDSIRRSLERLRADTVDLIQLHAIGDLDDLRAATGPGGAVKGAVRAREEGLVGAIGITGHGMRAPAVHLEALRRFPFDTVLTPFNYRLAREPAYLRDFDALAAETRDRDAGLMVIKVAARNLWRPEDEHRYATWYEPLDVQELIDATVAFALARPEVTGICTAGDVHLLPLFVEAERRRHEITVEQAEAALAGVSELESPFVRVPGREVPEWLESLMPES
jgi:aryl-alcohol dehydrogenase-like predicted oxidoreductase